MWKGMAERAVPILVRQTRPLRESVAKFLREDPESLRKKLAVATEGVDHHERQVAFQTEKLARFGPQTDVNFRYVASIKSDLRWHRDRLAEDIRKKDRLGRRLGIPMPQAGGEVAAE